MQLANTSCKGIGCTHVVYDQGDFCPECTDLVRPGQETSAPPDALQPPRPKTLAERYPRYYKATQGLTEVDVYAVHALFAIEDPSGAIHHASKKLLLSGARTGGKSTYDDIREARDTLSRWLELHDMLSV
jgi:hypothetical protein